MRERLIELFKQADEKAGEYIRDNDHMDFIPTEDELAGVYADHLLANSVIVPLCKVGDTVYVPWKWNGEKGIATIEVEEIRIYDSKNNYMFIIDMESDDEDYNQTYGGWKIGDEIGKTVFLTREEAEQALAKMKGEGE